MAEQTVPPEATPGGQKTPPVTPQQSIGDAQGAGPQESKTAETQQDKVRQDKTTVPETTVPAGPTTKEETKPSTEETKAKDEPLFTVDLEGEEKDFTPTQLIEFTQQKIDSALELANRYEKGMLAFAERPLDVALEAMTHGAFSGNRKAAYEMLMDMMREAVKAEDNWKALPEVERRAKELELELAFERSDKKRREEEQRQTGAQYEKVQASQRLLAEMTDAIKKTGLPETREVQKAMAAFMIQRRAETGSPPTSMEAAEHLKRTPYLYLGEEEWLKTIPKERLEAIR